MLSEDERDDLIADNNFQHGREYERERIIALLEENASINEADGAFFRGKQGKYSRTIGEALRLAIALIKGENNA